MEPLYQTTVAEMIYSTENQIAYLSGRISELRKTTLSIAKNAETFEQLRAIMDTHNEHQIESKLAQYEENLEYLKACYQERVVFLNQTEWRHYFHGTPRPELC